jgi:hypothetical protein
VCGTEGCVVPPEPSSTSCSSIETCRGGSTQPIPSFGSPASATTPSSGNVGAQNGVLPSRTAQTPVVKKKLTRAQQLVKALKSCKKLHEKKRRAACEASARRKYGPKKHAKAKRGKR